MYQLFFKRHGTLSALPPTPSCAAHTSAAAKRIVSTATAAAAAIVRCFFGHRLCCTVLFRHLSRHTHERHSAGRALRQQVLLLFLRLSVPRIGNRRRHHLCGVVSVCRVPLTLHGVLRKALSLVAPQKASPEGSSRVLRQE